MRGVPAWLLGSLVGVATMLERAGCVAAAAASVGVYRYEDGKPKGHDDWADEVVERADALRRALRRA